MIHPPGIEYHNNAFFSTLRLFRFISVLRLEAGKTGKKIYNSEKYPLHHAGKAYKEPENISIESAVPGKGLTSEGHRYIFRGPK